MTATAYRNMYIQIDEPARWEEITKIRVTDPNGTYWESTKTSSPSLSENWDSSDQAFEFYYMYSSTYPDSIPLGDYDLEITTGSLGTFTYTFEVSSVEGKKSGSILSKTGAGDDSQILDVASNVTASIDVSDDLTVNFDSVDSSVQDGYLWLFDSTDDSSYLGFRGWFSETHALRDSSSNSYTFSVSEFNANPQSVMVLLTATKEVNSQYMIYYRSSSILTTITTP